MIQSEQMVQYVTPPNSCCCTFMFDASQDALAHTVCAEAVYRGCVSRLCIEAVYRGCVPGFNVDTTSQLIDVERWAILS